MGGASFEASAEPGKLLGQKILSLGGDLPHLHHRPFNSPGYGNVIGHFSRNLSTAALRLIPLN